MDGTFHELDEELNDHPNGRCAMIPVTRPWSEVLGHDVPGASEPAQPWHPQAAFDKLSEKQQRAILGKTRYELYKSGDADLRDFGAMRGGATWGKQPGIRPVKELAEVGGAIPVTPSVPSAPWTASPQFVEAVEAGQAARLAEVAARYDMSVDAYKAASTARMRELVEQGVPSVQIQGDQLLQVLADGRFKSQFETGTSGGHLSTELRAKFEKHALGIAEDSEAVKRPIYGFLGDPKSDVAQSGLGPRTYGNVTVRLKDSVRERMTVTYGDSASINRWAESPSALPMRAVDVDYRVAAHTVEPWVQSPLDCKSLSNVPPGYVEAQYLGGLKVDDISEVIIESGPQAHYETYTPPAQELLDSLTKRGIKWRLSK
jgi:hypothetical protein